MSKKVTSVTLTHETESHLSQEKVNTDKVIHN